MPALTEKLIANLPFDGFYNSLYSDAIDQCEERDAEYMADEKEETFPPELRITADEFREILFDVTDYSAAYQSLAGQYVEAFDYVAREEHSIRLGLEWESMDSPREYNFATDRVYARISYGTVLRLFAISKRDEHAGLTAAIRARFTSRDGFISHYPNSLDAWLSKPLAEWDHNELCTLLIAVLPAMAKDEDLAIYYRTVDSEGDYTAWSDSVDWPKFYAKVADLRADKEAELRTDDPEYIPAAIRCDATIDMFTGRVG